MSEENTGEEVASEEVPTKKKKAKPEKFMPWLRPITGFFSILSGLMYVAAAALIYLVVKSWGFAEQADMAAIETSLIEQGTATSENAAEKAQALIDTNLFAAERIGALFPVSLALLSCFGLLVVASGVGLMMKKNWSISLGRLSCIGTIVTIFIIFIFHQGAFADIIERFNETKLMEDIKPFGWMSAIRYVCLCSMCPIVLIVGQAAIVKQHQASQTEASEA